MVAAIGAVLIDWRWGCGSFVGFGEEGVCFFEATFFDILAVAADEEGYEEEGEEEG